MKNETKNLLKWYMSSYGRAVIGGILFAVGGILLVEGAYVEGAQNNLVKMYAADAEATMNTVEKMEKH